MRLPARADRSLSAQGLQNELGDETQQDSGRYPPAGPAGRPELAPRPEQLVDHVDDRTAGQGEEQNGEQLRGVRKACDSTQKRRPAGDEPAEGEETPTHAFLVSQRGRDAESLRGVVQPETNDQRQCQRQLARLRRTPYGETFREVVQPDARGDQKRQAPHRLAVAQNMLPVVNEAQKPGTEAQSHYQEQQKKPGLTFLQRLLHGRDRVLHHLDEKEQQYPYGESIEKR